MVKPPFVPFLAMNLNTSMAKSNEWTSETLNVVEIVVPVGFFLDVYASKPYKSTVSHICNGYKTAKNPLIGFRLYWLFFVFSKRSFSLIHNRSRYCWRTTGLIKLHFLRRISSTVVDRGDIARSDSRFQTKPISFRLRSLVAICARLVKFL